MVKCVILYCELHAFVVSSQGNLSVNSIPFSAKLRIRGCNSCSLVLEYTRMEWLTAALYFQSSGRISQPLKGRKDFVSK